MMNLVEKYLGENKDELVKMTFYITYVFLLTTATITFIEAMRTKDAKIRNILNLETCISVVASYFYGKFVNDIEKEGVNYKKINLTRYTDWYITTPIMLLVLVLALLYNTGGRLNFFTFLKILVLNFTMLTFGYLGETGAISKMNGQIFGFAAFFALYGFIYKTFLSKKYIFDNSILYWSFVIFWSGYGLLYFAVIGIYGFQGIPRSIGIIQPLILFLGISSSRVIIRYLFVKTFPFKNSKNKKKVLIYGAGNAGRQLLSSLENNPEMKVVGFLDDNQQFHKQTILGQTVYDPLKIDKLIKLKVIDLVLLALP